MSNGADCGKPEIRLTCLAQSRLREMLPLLALVVQLLHPRLVAALRHLALLVQEVQDAQLALDEVNARLKPWKYKFSTISI